MATILAERTVAGGKIVKVRCTSCGHGHWTSANYPKSQCGDCDPPLPNPEMRLGIGRNLDRKRSDTNYHGGGYSG